MNECILFEEICLGMFSSLNDFIPGYDDVVDDSANGKTQD